ncbi:MAG: diguanylate cyclase [Fervidobacterium sp.]|uniref:Diguanylate cyclase (GGDEF) domain-containing protein n=1 Tax=Fervidobacterium gondwanense DSM 13020 TaxID=1121883 RepID=A0A1M7SJG2_FERGO|nr:diguanylate cyclase [Fervidobacterium gondwanense]UXF01590.1 diguanylate cyclase [Fervidobacterium riparium]SHN58570.1 diguanylate cyclase (GGDEF) domain-containing protein [Fervidobacterium gondwanense DSM 13020]
MRSLIENHVDDFLEILTYEKRFWKDFWENLPFKPITENYASSFSNFFERLLNISRNELTEFSHDYETKKESLKEELSIRIRQHARDLELSKEDFVVYLIAGLGEKDWIVVDGKKEKVIVFDVFSLWRKGKFDNLPDAVYQAAVHFRHGENEGNYYDKSEIFSYLKDEISRLNGTDILQKVCELLDRNVPYYNWTGFYLMDEEGMLVLGPYVGEPTEHVRIAVGKGICGQAAETKLTFVVQDVTQETNYLSCSPHVKSEIVVPIFRNDGSVFGEIDIDSHYKAPFDERDREFLEWIAQQLRVKVVHFQEFNRRIKIAYLDSYVSYLLSEIVKYEIPMSVDLFIYYEPEKVPENLYKFWRIARKLPNAYVGKVVVVDSVEDQKVVITSTHGEYTLTYEALNLSASDIVYKMIRETTPYISKTLFEIHQNATRFAQSFVNTSLITEYVLKPESDINKTFYAFLTGITAGYSGSFNRAMFFYHRNGNFVFQKAIGPRTLEEAQELWEAIEDVELNMTDFLETVSKDFKSEIEMLYKAKAIPAKILNEFLDGEPHIVNRNILPTVADDFDITNEFAIMALKSGDSIVGLLLADNNFDQKSITDYQLSVLQNLGNLMVLVIENRRFLETLKERAEIDALTELKSRRAFEEFISNIHPNQSFSIVFLDLNKFKVINDTQGHEKGDEILRVWGKCVNNSIRKDDIAFRYGGDEVVLILNTLEKSDIEKVVHRIEECFRNSTSLTFSSGVSFYPSEGDIQHVLRLADERCYRSKLFGKIEFPSQK